MFSTLYSGMFSTVYSKVLGAIYKRQGWGLNQGEKSAQPATCTSGYSLLYSTVYSSVYNTVYGVGFSLVKVCGVTRHSLGL